MGDPDDDRLFSVESFDYNKSSRIFGIYPRDEGILMMNIDNTLDEYHRIGGRVVKKLKVPSGDATRSFWTNKSGNRCLLETKGSVLYFYAPKLPNFQRIGVIRDGTIATVFFDDDPMETDRTGDIFVCLANGGVLVLSLQVRAAQSGEGASIALTGFTSFPDLFKGYRILDFKMFRTRESEMRAEDIRRILKEFDKLTTLMKDFMKRNKNGRNMEGMFCFGSEEAFRQLDKEMKKVISDVEKALNRQIAAEFLGFLSGVSELSDVIVNTFREKMRGMVECIVECLNVSKVRGLIEKETDLKNAVLAAGQKLATWRAEMTQFNEELVEVTVLAWRLLCVCRNGKKNSNFTREQRHQLKTHVPALKNELANISDYVWDRSAPNARRVRQLTSGIFKVGLHGMDVAIKLLKPQVAESKKVIDNIAESVRSVVEPEQEDEMKIVIPKSATMMRLDVELINKLQKRLMHGLGIMHTSVNNFDKLTTACAKRLNVLDVWTEAKEQLADVGPVVTHICILTSEVLLHFSSDDCPNALLQSVKKSKKRQMGVRGCSKTNEILLLSRKDQVELLKPSYLAYRARSPLEGERTELPDFVVTSQLSTGGQIILCIKHLGHTYSGDVKEIVLKDREKVIDLSMDKDRIVHYAFTESSFLVVTERQVFDFDLRMDGPVAKKIWGTEFKESAMLPIQSAVYSQTLGLLVYTWIAARCVDRRKAIRYMYDKGKKNGDFVLARNVARNDVERREISFKEFLRTIKEWTKTKQHTHTFAHMMKKFDVMFQKSNCDHYEVLVFLLNEECAKLMKEKGMDECNEGDLIWCYLVHYLEGALDAYHPFRGVQIKLFASMFFALRLGEYALNYTPMSNGSRVSLDRKLLDNAIKSEPDSGNALFANDKRRLPDNREGLIDLLKRRHAHIPRDIAYHIAIQYPTLSCEALVAACGDIDCDVTSDKCRVDIRTLANVLTLYAALTIGESKGDGSNMAAVMQALKAVLVQGDGDRATLAYRLACHAVRNGIYPSHIINSFSNNDINPSSVYMTLITCCKGLESPEYGQTQKKEELMKDIIEYMKKMHSADSSGEAATFYMSVLAEAKRTDEILAIEFNKSHCDRILTCYRTIETDRIVASNMLEKLKLSAFQLDVLLDASSQAARLDYEVTDAVKRMEPEAFVYLIRAASRRDVGNSFEKICESVVRVGKKTESSKTMSKVISYIPSKTIQKISGNETMHRAFEAAFVGVHAESEKERAKTNKFDEQTTSVSNQYSCDVPSFNDCDLCHTMLMSEPYLVYPCGHTFHLSCRDAWIAREKFETTDRVTRSCALCGELARVVMAKPLIQDEASDSFMFVNTVEERKRQRVKSDEYSDDDDY